MELNLTANGKAQELILAYLQENASNILAEKINNGVLIEKDGKKLVSKKTLDGFMKYASDEARKLAEKGARSACVEDAVVYGWAIHYFEESSIEGTLYNEDGSEYKPAPKTTPKVTPAPAPKKKENPQMSLFNLLNTEKNTPMSEDKVSDDDEDADMEVDEETGEVLRPTSATNPEEDTDDEEIEELSQEEMRKFDGDVEVPTVTRIVNGLSGQIAPLGEKAADIRRAGEILQAIEELPEDDDELDEEHLRTSFDKETMLYLYDLLDGKMDIK